MVSTVDICNLALDELGEAAITALDEGSPVANLCSRNYAPARDQVLRSHPWNFAVARRRLARLSAVPAFGFAYAYQRPTDWLRTISVHAGDGGTDAVPYRMEGDRFVSGAADLFLRYIARIEDPNQYDPLFVDALAMRSPRGWPRRSPNRPARRSGSRRCTATPCARHGRSTASRISPSNRRTGAGWRRAGRGWRDPRPSTSAQDEASTGSG